MLLSPAVVACADTSRRVDGQASSRDRVVATQLGSFYGLAFEPAPSLAKIAADHPSATPAENAALLLRELAAQGEPAWPSGAMMVPAVSSPGGPHRVAPSPATNAIRYTCGITLVSPSYAITAGHCVTEDDADPSELKLRLYRITPELAKTYVPATVSGTFPSYSTQQLSESDGFVFDEYPCTILNRCYGTSAFNCPDSSKDIALVHCDGRPGDKYGFINANSEGDPSGKEALVHWKHEVLDLGGQESTLPQDRLDHYVSYPSSPEQNYHYFDGAADLLPLRSIDWSDGTPTRWLASYWVDVHGCHGTSGSGMLARLGNTPVYELVGPVAKGGSAFSGRLCEQVPNPGGTTSGKGTQAMGADGLSPNALISLHATDFANDCRTRAVAERDVADLPFDAGSHRVSTIFSHLVCQVDDFGADGTVTADPVFGPYPEKFVEDASGTLQPIGGFSAEAGADYRVGVQVMPRESCANGCGALRLTVGSSTYDAAPDADGPSVVAATFPAVATATLTLGISNTGQLRAFGGFVLIREGQVNSFDTPEDRLEAALYALVNGGSIAAGPLPMRFAGDGTAGFEAVLAPGERIALLRQALPAGHRWTVRLGAPSYEDLSCGLLDREGIPLGSAPCGAVVHIDDQDGDEARLGFFVELSSASERESAELRTVAIASDAARDADDDGIPDVLDNCPADWNASQGSCDEEPPVTGEAGATGESGAGNGEAGARGSGGTGGTGSGNEGGVAGEATNATGGTSTSTDAGAAGAEEQAGTGNVAAGTGGSSGGGAGAAGTSGGGTAGLGGLGGSAGDAATAGGGPTPNAASSKDDSGCGCRVGSERSTSSTWLSALFVAALAARRRRRTPS